MSELPAHPSAKNYSGKRIFNAKKIKQYFLSLKMPFYPRFFTIKNYKVFFVFIKVRKLKSV